MPAKTAKSNRAAPSAPTPLRRETWKVVVYYRFIAMDLTERTESYLMGADTQLAAQNAADQAVKNGLWLVNGPVFDRIPPARILQVTIYSEAV